MNLRPHHLLDLMHRIEADVDVDVEVLHRRDREIAEHLSLSGLEPRDQTLAWLGALEPHQFTRSVQLFRQVETAIGVTLVALGLILGAVAAKFALRYDGSQPINVVEFIAGLVLVQLALLILTGLVALPSRWRQSIPGFEALQSLCSLLSPGRLRGLVARWLPQSMRDAYQAGAGLLRQHRGRFASVDKWIVLRWSQWFAVAFNVGALSALLALVVFTDLAFGWSTTLEVSNASVSTLIYWLTLPWAAWVPSAVPDGALIDATRYFRGDTMSTQGLAERGAWWKFCFAALFFYGLLPRMLTSLFAQLALVRSLENGFELTPGMQAVRARFAQPLVQTQADQPEAMPMARPGSSDPEPDRAHMTGDGAAAATLLSWAGADEASPRVAGVVAGRFAADVASALPVGGGRTLSEDLQTIEQVKHGSDSTPVVLLTKAWEPPLLELFDFVDSLREAVGDARELVVAPVVLEAEPAGDRQIAQWRKKLLELGDGRTRLQPLRVNDDG